MKSFVHCSRGLHYREERGQTRDRPLLEMQHARFLSVTVKSIVKGKTTGTRRGRQVPWSSLKGMARIRVRQNGAAFGSVPFFPSCPFPPFAISLPPPALCSLCGYPCFRLAGTARPTFRLFSRLFCPIALPFRGADGAAPSLWASVPLCDFPPPRRHSFAAERKSCRCSCRYSWPL